MSDQKKPGHGPPSAFEWLRKRGQSQEGGGQAKEGEKKTAEVKSPQQSKPKIGAGHFSAMGRLGLKELRNAMNPSKESVADTEFGLYGTRTQGEVANDRGVYGPDAKPAQAAKGTPKATVKEPEIGPPEAQADKGAEANQEVTLAKQPSRGRGR